MNDSDVIVAHIVEKDLFELTEQSQLWGVDKVKNEIQKNVQSAPKRNALPKGRAKLH